MSVKLYFKERAIRKLVQINKDNVKDVKKALRAAGKPVLAEAKTLAPVATGALRDSLRIGTGGKAEKGVVRMAVVIGTKLFAGKTFYGAFQEFGHWGGYGVRVGRRTDAAEAKEAYAEASRKAGRRWIPGKHYLQFAAEEKGDEAKAIFAAKIKELIESK